MNTLFRRQIIDIGRRTTCAKAQKNIELLKQQPKRKLEEKVGWCVASSGNGNDGGHALGEFLLVLICTGGTYWVWFDKRGLFKKK